MSASPTAPPPAAEAARAHAQGQRGILAGLVLGALAGVGANWLGHAWPASLPTIRVLSDAVAHPIGQVFLRLLFVVVVPLVFASLAVGVATLGDPRRLGRLGLRTLAFFLGTSAFATTLGIGAMQLVRPGVGFDPAVRSQLMESFGGQLASVESAAAAQRPDSLLDTVNRILDQALPRNVLGAITQMQMLPLILGALLFGLALASLPNGRGKPLVALLEIVQDAMVAIVGMAMKLAPLAVFCLLFVVTARFGIELLGKLSLYVAVVLGCYLVQILGLYPLVLRFLTGRRPSEWFRSAFPVIATAFSTSSSSATLPTSLKVARERLGLHPEVAGFVLPLGATMNMNGTALFEGVVVLFIAQIFGVHLTLPDQVLVVALCVLSSVGAAGVPGGALPLLMIVMAQVGVPPDGIAIVLGVDRLLDMGRTVVNVLGDLVCATWVDAGESARMRRAAATG